MPNGPGTYGSKVGRPAKKKKKMNAGGYMGASGNTALAKKKKDEAMEKASKVKASHGSYMKKKKK